MRTSLQELMTKYSGTDIFIIGGGNSLRGFDFTQLEGKSVISVNAACRYVNTEDSVIFWADAPWADENERLLASHPAKFRFHSCPVAQAAIRSDMKGFHNADYLLHTGDYGYDPHIDNVKGNSSGTQAINFALNLNPRKIILLGFDMQHVNNRTHFHDHHNSTTGFMTYRDLFIPSINKLAEDSRYRGIPIINCSRSTALTCFKIGDIKEYL